MEDFNDNYFARDTNNNSHPEWNSYNVIKKDGITENYLNSLNGINNQDKVIKCILIKQELDKLEKKINKFFQLYFRKIGN